MSDNNRMILYSHGFGVRSDDRGLFTDIAQSLPLFKHVMFDYNQFDDSRNTLTVSPLDTQADMLQRQYSELRAEHPNGTVDLICHSQGCVAAGLAQLKGIRKTLLLAPPTQFLGTEQKIQQMMERDGTKFENGVVKYPRRDGSTTIVGQDYLQSRDKASEPIALYNKLSDLSDVTIINALNDEVLGKQDYTGLSNNIIQIDKAANHDFTSDARSELLDTLKSILQY